MHRFCLGFSADLSDRGSVHAATFMRAIDLALNDGRANVRPGPRIVYHSDEASASGGARAARALIRERVNCVVGHYASAAAERAAAFYELAGVPLFLPAATADHLTASFQNTFRLCGPDRLFASMMADDMSCHFNYRRIGLLHDNTRHGTCLSEVLRASLVRLGLSVSGDWHDVDAVVFVGSFSASVNFVNCYAGDLAASIILTDDAAHDQLAREIKSRHEGVYVYGFAPPTWHAEAVHAVDAYVSRFKRLPGTYFLETYAAIEIAVKVASRVKTSSEALTLIPTRTWPTVLGDIGFSGGESGKGAYALWTMAKDALVPIRRLGSPLMAATGNIINN